MAVSLSLPTIDKEVKHEGDHAEDSLEGLDEEIALLEGNELRSHKTGLAHVDGDATWQREVWGFIGYMIPIFGNQLLWRYFSILGPVTQMGKNGSLALAGGALANTTISLLVVVPSHSASSALDTLSTQAHGGSKYSTMKDLNRLYTLRVYLVMWIEMAVLIPLICLFEPIFVLLQVEPDVAHIAGKYMQYAALGVPGFFTYECMRKYCQAQGLMVGPAAAIALAAIPTFPLLTSDWFGLYTPAIALGFFWNTMAILEAAYIFYFLPKSTFQDIPSFKIVSQDLAIVIKLTLAGFVSIGADFFAWEFLNFASAWMGNDVLAANSVILSSCHFFFSLPSALMNSSATRVGNYLGSNQPLNAKTAAFTSLSMGLAIAASAATIISVFSRSWASIFSEDPVILEIVRNIMPFFCFITFLDAIQGIAGGILRGAGMPIEIARAMAMSHYLVGLPLAFTFAFGLHGGLSGLWLGFAVGLCIASARLVYLILFNDWQGSARKAQAHLQASDGRSVPLAVTHAV
ncbi:mate-domain-containing protein [Cystobasidium minutum MCA 4210]|uniref:mate-domain-containing protein n=1 Tax=Cystobasidium minutum MCA 4210 TaxID=1397322 RepID=UPI0034CF1575|eukprot:jgi/Rhomi1/166193/fgenesh1_kg.1_\